MEAAYAQALWKLVQGGMEYKKALHALREMLVERGRLSLLPRIARAFERLAAREHSRTTMTLTVARDADIPKARKAAVEELAGAKIAETDLDICLDETLVGGWRLEGREHLVDASFKKYLLSLYNRATQ